MILPLFTLLQQDAVLPLYFQLFYINQSRNRMKQSTIKAIILLAAVFLLSFLVWDHSEEVQTTKSRLLISYQTSSTRSKNVQNYCPSNLDRSTLASSSQLSAAQSLKSTLNSQLGIDGNTLINQLARGNLGGATTTAMGGIVGLGFYIGAFLLPFLVFLMAWPFLCCCCCCPSCCPSKCCQKPQSQPYSKCEMYWPAITLALAFLLIISVGIYGFTSASTVGPTFKSMGCSLAIFTDDLLNGNVTLSGTSFFTGLNLFSGNLGYLGGNLTNIKNNLTDLSNLASGTTYTQVNNIQTAIPTIKNIPDNAGVAAMNLNYNTPISASPATGTLASSFNSILGTWSTSKTLVSNLYAPVQYARALMYSIKNNSNNFAGQVSNIQSSISTMNTTIQSLIKDVNGMDDSMGTLISFLSTPSAYGNVGMQAFYGALVGFSIFGLLGLMLTACCQKTGCRHLMYISCFVLFLMGWATFIIAVMFSVLVPVFTWTCSYLDVAMANSTGFQNNFGAFLSNSTLNQIGVCMPFGDGNIVNTIGGNAKDGLNNLTYVITSLSSYNNTLLKSYISGNLSSLVSTTNSYANGDISDLDSANNAILAGFSNPNNATNNALCNASFVDSWVPSNNQNAAYASAVYCQSQSANVGSYSTCDVNLAPTSTCKGCMDTTQILTRHSNTAAVVSAVKGKYGANCAFAALLGNAWTNYFSKKYATLGFPTAVTQVAGTVMHRVKQAQDIVNVSANSASVFANIDAFKASLNTISANMNSISTLTDPNYGMLAGLNCKVFGQDFVTFQNVICGSFYNNVYNIRIMFGISAWGILFVLCCTVCTGVRHYKQMNRRVKVGVIEQTTLKNSFEEERSKRVLRRNKSSYRVQDLD